MAVLAGSSRLRGSGTGDLDLHPLHWPVVFEPSSAKPQVLGSIKSLASALPTPVTSRRILAFA